MEPGLGKKITFEAEELTEEKMAEWGMRDGESGIKWVMMIGFESIAGEAVAVDADGAASFFALPSLLLILLLLRFLQLLLFFFL